MKILGIGNAIVDVICKVRDDFIQKNGLTKSTMKLIFEGKEFLLLNWLRQNVHIHGRKMNAEDLVQSVTGEPLSSEAFLSYLRKKINRLQTTS